MTKRLSAFVLSAVLLSTVLLALNVKVLQSQQTQPNILRGNIVLPCGTANRLIWSDGTAAQPCPVVTIDIKNNGTCAIEVVLKCAGQEMARFGPQPGQRVVQGGVQADQIFITCQEIPNSTRCRGSYVLRW